jgi:hypothetical protein
MTFDDLLDELRTNMLRDIAAPYLWSDAALARYMQDAQQRFARQSLCIRDASTTSVTQISLSAGIDMYTLHPSVYAVVSANFNAGSVDLARAGHSQLDGSVAPDTLWFDVNDVTTFPPGIPRAFTTDEQTVSGTAGQAAITLRVFPVPSATEEGLPVNLRVVRGPLVPFTEDSGSQLCEIPEDYQLDMLEWAAYRALRNHDADGGSAGTADGHKARFDAAVAEAAKEAKRRMFTPMKWGFGRNGFTYIR